MENIDWAGGVEVPGPEPELVEKQCAGNNCLTWFLPTWHTQRRCERCRREKRPYKTEDSPF